MATVNRAPGDYATESGTLDFAVFIRLLWSHRVTLAWTILGAMFVAGVASYLVDKEFLASAKIIVETPQRREETLIFPKPLSVLDYESMLNTDLALEQVLNSVKTLRGEVQKMVAEGKNPEDITALTVDQIRNQTGLNQDQADLLSLLSVRDIRGLTLYQDKDFKNLEFETFKKRFETRTVVVKETGVDIEYSPIIRLDAKANQPEKTSLLVNLWALSFVENEKERAARRSERIVNEILEIDKTLRRDLEAAVNQLQKYQEEIGVDQLRKEIRAKNFNLFGLVIEKVVETNPEDKTKKESEQVTTGDFETALLPQLARVQKELMAAESQLKLLNAYLEELEDGGNWIGQIQLSGDERTVANKIEAASEDYSRLNQQIKQDEKTYSLNQIREDLELIQNQLDLLRERLRTLQLQDRPGENADNLQSRISELQQQLDRLEERQQERQILQQKVLGLRTRLGTLEARENYLEAQNLTGKGSDLVDITWLQKELSMKDQELGKVRNQIFELSAQLAGSLPPEEAGSLKARQEFLQEAVKNIENERDSLRQKIQQQRREDRLTARQVEEASASLGVFRAEYLQMKRKQSELTQKIQENQARAMSLQAQIRQTRNEIEKISQKISAAEATLKNMEAERDAYETAIETFADQYSEAVMEQFRRESDVRIHSLAVPPDRRVAPSRFLWVFTAGALAFVLNMLVILFRRLLETAPNPA